MLVFSFKVGIYIFIFILPNKASDVPLFQANVINLTFFELTSKHIHD